MVNDVGPMDETMFLVYSDSDYAYMCRSKGWEVWYEPQSRVYHKLGASRNTTEWHQKDMQAFMKKWGIQVHPNGTYTVGPEFAKLDKFP